MALKIEAALRKDRTNTNSTMEHRHFATVAAILADMPARWSQRRVDIINHFADALRHTNPKFDRARFLRACGVVDGRVS